MADGAVLAHAGSSCLTIIAKEFNIPVFAISPKMRFSPKYYFAQDRANE
jgi:translation initiation factor 2B subunit (eIF-2B alpha/beta/delta family)